MGVWNLIKDGHTSDPLFNEKKDLLKKAETSRFSRLYPAIL